MKINDGIELFNEDNIKTMKRYQNKYFDIAIVDPPYGINGNSHRKNKSRSKAAKSKKYHDALWDQDVPTGIYFKELKRVSKKQVIFGANYFKEICGTTFDPPRREFYKEFIKENPNGWMIWDKVNSTTSFNDCELAFIGHEHKTEIIYYMWSGMMQGLTIGREGSVMNGDKASNEKRIHPTQKPVKLYEWLLMTYAEERKTVLDTHLGSGSIVIACHNLNLSFTGSEIDKTYFEDAVVRIQNHVDQLTIFDNGA